MLTTAALIEGADAIAAAITHAQAHSGDPGGAGTSNAVGSRVAVTPTVDGSGNITIVAEFTGLTPSQAVSWISYWSASSNGTYLGKTEITSGDTAANAAGEITITVVETASAS